MAAITTRQTAGTGATVNNAPLTNTQLDQNFINLKKYDFLCIDNRLNIIYII